ncbi:MAG TPA: inorganic phosphate transporter [Luteibaculaceae bacterium]|nr:inorganic phosphate transporter [Luteibaculaceae bacterium]
MFGLDTDLSVLLVICLLCACAFEFINGFHDTANAVATVIYTNSLKPTFAVIWSGFFNFLGVLLGGTAVAMGIMKLIPAGMIFELDVAHNVTLVLSILISAIIWNLGTWYFGIPCSSSHTLIGAMLGAGLSYTWFMGDGDLASGVNWSQALKVGTSLIVSPGLGFLMSFLLMKLLQKILRKKDALFNEPKKKTSPPWYIRFILIITCTLVSFFHGSNDGQKGVGLIMFILLAIVPAKFALDMTESPVKMIKQLEVVETVINGANYAKASEKTILAKLECTEQIKGIKSELTGITSLNQVADKNRSKIQQQILKLEKTVSDQIIKGEVLSATNEKAVKSSLKDLKETCEHVPNWVVIIISLSLGIGTMIGWKRIVKTIGEKIGKQHLSYAQGASAEFVAATTIGIASATGLPVSTTQVLSSGIAGTMVASGGTNNLQGKTVKNIFVAWLLTLPVTMFLSGFIFWLVIHFL